MINGQKICKFASRMTVLYEHFSTKKYGEDFVDVSVI